jgi:hypothetical protein
VQVINAKVPILKGTLLIDIPQHDLLNALASDNKAATQSLAAAAATQAAKGGTVLRVELQVDISIGISDSQAAVRYLQRQVRAECNISLHEPLRFHYILAAVRGFVWMKPPRLGRCVCMLCVDQCTIGALLMAREPVSPG